MSDGDAGGEPDRGEDRGPATRHAQWKPAAITAGASAVGAFLQQYPSGSYQGWAVVVLIIGCAVGAVAGAGLFEAVSRGLAGLELPSRWSLPSPRVLLPWVAGMIAAVGAVVLATTVLIPFAFRVNAEAFGCTPPATEFVVASSDGQNAATAELVARFERTTAIANDDQCPTVHGFVYDIDEATLRSGIGQGWEPAAGGSLVPLRDIGPRPDAWLAESTLAVNRLPAVDPPVVAPSPRSFAVSPIVVAVPQSVPAPAPATSGLSLPGLAVNLAATGLVRPDPTVSGVGALATAALYGIDVDRAPGPVDPPRSDERSVESRLTQAASRESYQSERETDLACHYRSSPEPRASLIVSEQSMRRLDEGLPLDSTCGSAPTRPRPSSVLRGFYPNAPVLDHRFVRFTWTPTDSDRGRAVARFEDWLHSNDGSAAVRAAGLRTPTPTDDGRGDIDAGAVDVGVIPRYLAARAPHRDLLAVDVSGSMSEPGRSGRPLRRLDEVGEAVTAALSRPRPSDQIGLWFFPGDAGGTTPRPVVEIGGSADPVGTTPRAQAVVDAVRSAAPQGNTPLFRTIVDGVDALAATEPGAQRRLVVVTDGENTIEGLTPAAVLDRVRGRGVQVDVVTLGDVSCDAEPLRKLEDATGGRCFDPGSTTENVTAALGEG